ncbi:methyltransferase domain-containing protein [Streptomyces canus]|uniref:SAM-dependent methyltransferase n=1 Tax=Streptomyces canus TaxID=58343 RepID=UPI00224D2859|nr:class I SAM-dependent methyltransferase [Streptomyces canus]MCX5252614.1 methyltransferase domain-containing protein [Streptomyces canus]
MTTTNAGFDVITGLADDPYQSRVEAVYRDDPAMWRNAIGDELWFQFGLYDGDDNASLDQAGERYFARQLDLAGLREGARVGRILDVGFGWGTTLLHMAKRFPDCPRIDGVNISGPQVRYTADRLAKAGVADRVRLYRCNAQDLEQIPDREPPYDLVVLRGSIGHLTPSTLEAAMKAISVRTADNAVVVISETLYNVPLGDYRSVIPDEVDRLACGHRKTLAHLVEVLERNSFAVRDLQELPSGPDAIRWLNEIKANIDRDDALPGHRPFAEMRDVAVNLSAALSAGKASIYSVVARRLP